MTTSPNGGAALPVQATDDPPTGGAAQPAYEVDGGAVIGDRPQAVYVVSDAEVESGAFRVAGGPALPVVFDDAHGAKGGKPIPIYLVNSFFDAEDIFSPNADPLTSTDDRSVTGNRWYSYQNMLYGGSAVGESAFGNSVVSWPALDWMPGSVVQLLIRWEDAESYGALVLGSTPTDSDPATDGLAWLWEFGRVVFGVPGKRVQLHNTHYAMQPKWYLATFVNLGDSNAVLLSTFGPESASWRVDPVDIAPFPDATLKYISRASMPVQVTPYLTAQGSPNTGEALRGHQAAHYRFQSYVDWSTSAALATFSDSFDGSGALVNGWTQNNGIWERQSGAVICTGFGPGANYATHATDLLNGNALWRCRIKLPAAGSFNAAFVFRQSGADYMRVVLDPDAWRLQAVQNNTYRYVVFQSGYTAVRNQWIDVAVWTHGTRYLVTIADAVMLADWFEDTDPAAAEYANYTGIGVATFEANTFFDDVQVLPHTLTLPPELQRGTMVPTAIRSTLLQSFGTVPLPGVGNVVQVQEYGTLLVRVRAHIQMPATVGRWTFIGCCVAYKDANNYFVVRMAADHDPVLGQPDDEIEVMQALGGVPLVVGKTQFPRIYVDNAEFDLDAQIVMVGKTPVVMVYLDGDYLESYPLPMELWSATKHGYYYHSDDSGAEIVSGAVYA